MCRVNFFSLIFLLLFLLLSSAPCHFHPSYAQLTGTTTTATVIGFCVIQCGVYQGMKFVMDIQIVTMALMKNAVGMTFVAAILLQWLLQ